MVKQYFEDLISELKRRKLSKAQMQALKRELGLKHKLKDFPTDIQIFLNAEQKDIPYLRKILRTKPTRSLSGVAVVAVMTKPMKCPHGKCAICPGGPNSVFGEVPQSYTGKEPATMRALRADFDPYVQVFNRLEQYVVTGHLANKIELIIMGGTFPSFPEKYQEEFVAYCFKAMNDFSDMFYSKGEIDIMKFKDFFELPGEVGSKERTEHIHEKLRIIKDIDLSRLSKTPLSRRLDGQSPLDFVLPATPKGPSPGWSSAAVACGEAGVAPCGMPSRTKRSFVRRTATAAALTFKKSSYKQTTLEDEQRRNENSEVRCVGMTIETRPDYAMLKHANRMLRLGCTKVELGVQSVYDEFLQKIERGHSVEDSIKATEILKDLGFKINYHYMLGLPGSNPDRDLIGLNRLFVDPRFRPDMLKIYPCMVVKGTKLYDEWKKGRFKPISTLEAADTIIEFKKNVPEYVRIMRVQRDIPTYATEAGVDRTNLRQHLQEMMAKKGIICRCIRCREIGRLEGKGAKKIKTIIYNASKGIEFFISAAKGDALLGFLRMRLPCRTLRKEITGKSALIRELHVFGAPAGFKDDEKKAIQHKGIGKELLKTAEKAAKGLGMKKMVVISGIGVRPYYKKLGYRLEGPYMVKIL